MARFRYSFPFRQFLLLTDYEKNYVQNFSQHVACRDFVLPLNNIRNFLLANGAVVVVVVDVSLLQINPFFLLPPLLLLLLSCPTNAESK